MPNLCENCLCITGKGEKMQRFFDFVSVEDTALNFDKIIPYTEEYRQLDETAEENGLAKEVEEKEEAS